MINKRYSIAFMLVLTVCMICLPATDVFAASAMNLYYYGTKKSETYTGKQVNYVLDNASIEMDNTPGILVNGYALASYQEIFVNSPIEIKSKYVSASGSLTLTKDDTTINFTVGSKKAKVNGKAVTLDVAPIKVKYKTQGAIRILVPTRFVAETFHYTYIWNSSTATASMTSPRHLYYNNKKVSYNSTNGNVTIDGKTVNLGGMKSIIVNSTALLQAKKVFSLTTIGATYDYNSSNKTVTLTKGTTVVSLVIGSSTAYVNGIAKKVDTAPLIVKDLDTDKSYVMVPGNFVANALGYNYTWNSYNKTSLITTKTTNNTDNSSDNSDNNSGNTDDADTSTGTIPTLDSVLVNWGLQSNYVTEYNTANGISNPTGIQNATDVTTNISSVNKDSATDSNIEVYSLHSATPFGNTTAVLNDNILTLQMLNTTSANNSTNFSGNIVQTIATASDSGNITTNVTFNLSSSKVKYNLTLSDDKCTMYITFYPNYINSITVGSKSGKDYMLINSSNELKVDITDGGNCLVLQIPNTINSIGANSADTSTLTSLKSLQVTSSPNMVTVIVGKSATAQYKTEQYGNTYVLSLYEAGTSNAGTITGNIGVNIPLPAGVNFSDITDEDRYYEKKIAVILPGDYKDYYTANPVSVLSNVVNNVSVVNNDYNQTEIIINTSKLQGYRLSQSNGSIAVTLGNPKDIYPNIVVLDPGHGGYQPGAIYSLNGDSYNEKDINLSILYDKASKYFNSKTSKIKVYYTRQDDSYVSLDDRAAYASKVGADLFVSLHMNALPSNTAIKGTDIYYGITNYAMTSSGLDSETLAGFMMDNLPGAIGTDARKIVGSNLAVNKKNTVPAILIELGFMTNKSDMSLMVDDDFQETTGKAIYDALCSLFEEYPTGR